MDAPDALSDQVGLLAGRPARGREAVAPASSLVDDVRRLFAELFEVDVGREDDFFDLGGDSLAGETLLAAFEREFGVALPLSILLEAPTPRALAEAIAAKRKAALPTILFAARDAGSRTPLFCIHGWNGTAAFSRKIRNVLPDRPIYAIRPLGLLPGEVPLLSVPEMARSYIQEIRRVRASGPYHIFGQCGTANVAYEVAQQLSAAGERVGALILGDPVRLKRRSRIRRFYYGLIGSRAVGAARRFPELTGAERWRRVIAPALTAATKTYEPRPYPGRVLLVASSENVDELLHPRRGYPALIPDIETVIVEGDHLKVFAGMNPDAPGPLARAMSSFLARYG